MNVFNTVTLKQIFWKRKTIFEKLEYQFLVQSTKIEKTIFPHKTALSDVSVKTDRMGSIKWTYNKEWSFPRNYFIFLKILFQLSINYSNFPIYTFHKHWSFIWESFFSVSILKLVLLEIPEWVIPAKFNRGPESMFSDLLHITICLFLWEKYFLEISAS